MGIEIKVELNLTEIYEDALQPVCKQVGRVFEDMGKTARLILAPITLCGIAHDRFDKWCARLSNEVDEKNMAEPQPNILIPTLAGLSINPDETLLGEMFFNILKSSVDKTKQQILNPAFPKILEQLSRDEARILTLLKLNGAIDCVYYSFSNEESIYEEQVIEVSHNFDKDFFGMYKNHLMLLGLITVGFYKEGEAYFQRNKDLIPYNSAEGKEILKNKQDGYKTINKLFQRLGYTSFGRAFAEVCINDKCKEYCGD